MVYMYHSFLIHSSADGHLGCFHVLAMINSAAMNIGVHVSLSDLVGNRTLKGNDIRTDERTRFVVPCSMKIELWARGRDLGGGLPYNNSLSSFSVEVAFLYMCMFFTKIIFKVTCKY